MSTLPIVGSGGTMFSGRPSVAWSYVVPPVTSQYLFTLWTDFNETCHQKEPSCKWTFLERFLRSEVKGEGYCETKYTFSIGGMHLGDVALKLTCYNLECNDYTATLMQTAAWELCTVKTRVSEMLVL